MSLTIHTHDLIKSYRNRTVVNHVSVEVKQGEIVGLLGPNGAGKTTTFYMVVGLIRPDEGKVFLNDEDITRQPMFKRAQMGLGYLPQEASVFRKLTVEDNIKAILEMTKLTKLQQKDKLETLLDEFGLQHVRKNNGDSLSGGERRRTEIARALAVDPKFILLDEPFAGVDPIAVEDIQTVVARLKTKNIGILITDHNVNETLSICDRAYLLIEGKIFKHGTAEELADDEDVRRLYLGRNFELKRKDYLHEEARGTFSSASNLETNVDRLIQFTEHTIARTKSVLDYIDNFRIGNSKGNMAIDMKADEYMNQVNELKTSIVNFANNKQHNELLSAALDIPHLNYKEYEKLFSLKDFTSLIGGIVGGVTTAIYFEKISHLKDQLLEIDSALGKCAIYLKAAA